MENDLSLCDQQLLGFLLFERDAVDGELLHRRLADTHICDHGLHLFPLALQQDIQAGAKPAVLAHSMTMTFLDSERRQSTMQSIADILINHQYYNTGLHIKICN